MAMVLTKQAAESIVAAFDNAATMGSLTRQDGQHNSVSRYKYLHTLVVGEKLHDLFGEVRGRAQVLVQHKESL